MNYHIWAIDKSQYLKKLTLIQKNKLLEQFNIMNVKKGDVALKKGTSRAAKLLIMIEGKIIQVQSYFFILLFKKKSQKTLIEKGEVFGE